MLTALNILDRLGHFFLERKSAMDNNSFTPSQVGTLLEAMDKKIDLIMEIVSPFPARFDRMEEKLERIEVRLTAVEDVVRIAIPSLTKRVERLESSS